MARPAGEIPSPGAVTVEDVARVAGVSRQTVSRVLNDHPAVAPATRRRVRAAMVDLCWAPDPAARALGRRSALRSVPPASVGWVGSAAIAELRAEGFRVVEVRAGSSPQELVGLLALDGGGPGLIVRVVPDQTP